MHPVVSGRCRRSWGSVHSSRARSVVLVALVAGLGLGTRAEGAVEAAPVAPPPAAQSTAVLTGQVSAPGGIVVSDATVRVTELHREVQVDDTGSFRIEGLPPGLYLVEVTSPRWGQAVQRLEVASDGETRLDVELNLALHHEAIVVSARTDARTLNELTQPVSVLSGQALRVRDDATIGETLAQQAGVSSTGYSPGASRPIIRGLEGPRIRVLEAGIGSLDVSDTSPDHAVSFDPLSVEQAEIVRGPATLLYGSNAVGGVVNVLTDRIPTVRADRPVRGSVDLFAGSVADYWGGRASIDAGRGPVQVHGDFMKRKTDDYSIPGYAWSEALRLEEEEEHHDEEGAESPFGTLPNSDLNNQGGSVGLSFVGNRGFIGASFTGYDTNFGIPPGAHAHEEEEHHDEEGEEGDHHDGEEEGEEGPIRLDLRQRRLDLNSELHDPFGGFRTAKVRFGYADYTHTELEGAAIGTQFFNDAWEGRLELTHDPWGLAQGSFGIQVGRRELDALGDEAFIPPTRTNAWGIFGFEELGRGPWKAQLGARYESQDVASLGEDPGSRDLSGFTASVGTTWTGATGWGLGVTLTRADRLPTAVELFADGPHIATQTFEIGNAALDNETSWGLDATFGKREGAVTAEVSGFWNSFDGYIYERFTGEIEDGLFVVEFAQADARFAGFEVQAAADVLHRGSQHLDLEVAADYVWAELRDGTPVPRIPPFGWRAALHYRDVRWTGILEVRGRAEQTRVTELELPTEGYTFLNATLGYRFFTGRTVFELMLTGRNLTNAEGRNHSSFTKEFVPLPGRDVRLALRVDF